MKGHSGGSPHPKNLPLRPPCGMHQGAGLCSRCRAQGPAPGSLLLTQRCRALQHGHSFHVGPWAPTPDTWPGSVGITCDVQAPDSHGGRSKDVHR